MKRPNIVRPLAGAPSYISDAERAWHARIGDSPAKPPGAALVALIRGAPEVSVDRLFVLRRRLNGQGTDEIRSLIEGRIRHLLQLPADAPIQRGAA